METRNRCPGINSASLCSLAGRYDNPIPTRCLAPIDFLKIPAPVSTTVQFSLRNEGSSGYMCLCEGRESLCSNFQTFQDPRHQFHGISRLVSGLLFRGLFIATYAGGNDSWEIFALLNSLKIRALENYVCLLRHTFTGS
jgi:hypothetical protein